MSETNVHCSPPSIAILNAARRALEINSRVGNELRSQLARRVRQFRARLREMGLSSTGGLFPVQTLKIPSDAGQTPPPGITAQRCAIGSAPRTHQGWSTTYFHHYSASPVV